jgi:hypothetical protein
MFPFCCFVPFCFMDLVEVLFHGGQPRNQEAWSRPSGGFQGASRMASSRRSRGRLLIYAEHFICKQMDNIFSPWLNKMSDTRSTIHAIPSHPSRPQQRSRVASGLWRRREILKGARYDRVAPMKTSSDCFWSLDGLPEPNPSQTFCDCKSLARLSALWQSSVGR